MTRITYPTEIHHLTTFSLLPNCTHFASRKIYPKLKEWQDQVKMVIIEGAGEKAFCAGGDIRAITDSKGSPSQGDFFREEYQA